MVLNKKSLMITSRERRLGGCRMGVFEFGQVKMPKSLPWIELKVYSPRPIPLMTQAKAREKMLVSIFSMGKIVFFFIL